jgi:hypothetical protein
VTPNAQLIGFILAVCIPSFTALTAALMSNARISDINGRIADLGSRMDVRITDLRAHLDQRLQAQDTLFTEKLKRVEEVMDARLSRIEEHLPLK